MHRSEKWNSVFKKKTCKYSRKKTNLQDSICSLKLKHCKKTVPLGWCRTRECSVANCHYAWNVIGDSPEYDVGGKIRGCPLKCACARKKEERELSFVCLELERVRGACFPLSTFHRLNCVGLEWVWLIVIHSCVWITKGVGRGSDKSINNNWDRKKFGY